MGKLIYSAITSLDGYIEDATGNFEWAAPDDDVHAFINEEERSIKTYLFGRRMYEVMAVWDSPEMLPDQGPIMLDFAAMWKAADKIVYSTTLKSISTAKTGLEPRFDPEAIRQLKQSARADIAVGGPNLAASAFAAGLVDECHLYLHPIAIGAGKPSLPKDQRIELELIEERPFPSGVVFLRYRVRH